MGRSAVSDDSYGQAQAYYNAGNFRRCHEVAVQGLADSPEDVRLLRLAARAGLELNLEDAADYLQRVVNLQPDDVQSWHELGDALVDEGRMSEATAAFREALRLRPNDAEAMVDLGHLLYAQGKADEGIALLQQAAELEPGNLSTLRSLSDMFSRAGRPQEALSAAEQITRWQPEDVLATMDIADLNLALGSIDGSVAAYSRLRQIDPESEHEVYAYHGMIQAEMQRERWRRVLDLAIDATRVDRYGLTTDLLAFAVAQVFGAGDRPAPSRAEIDAALAAEHAEHRRIHIEELAF